jgi:hypothetical protein
MLNNLSHLFQLDIERKGHQYILESNYRLDCDLRLDILHSNHKFLDMGQCIFL